MSSQHRMQRFVTIQSHTHTHKHTLTATHMYVDSQLHITGISIHLQTTDKRPHSLRGFSRKRCLSETRSRSSNVGKNVLSLSAIFCWTPPCLIHMAFQSSQPKGLSTEHVSCRTRRGTWKCNFIPLCSTFSEAWNCSLPSILNAGLWQLATSAQGQPCS